MIAETSEPPQLRDPIMGAVTRPAAIAAHALRRTFRRREVLRGLTFTVPAGSVTGLLGRNGAGKTTLIRILCGLLPPSGGTATVLGHDVVRERPSIGGRLAAVFDPPRFYPYLTATQNLAVAARSWHLRPGRDELSAALETVNLADAAHRRAGQFSSGMQRRLGLAAALLGDPEVLVLDEPMNGLDPAGVEEFRAVVRGLVARGRTILLSSHVLSEIEQLCDHAVIIADGETVLEGALPSLLGEPRYRIDVAAPVASLPAIPGVAIEALHDPYGLSVTAADLDAALRGLVTAGVGVRHVEPVGRRLETIFLEETRERPLPVERAG
jgi:ABC-2 type transport system ATP-binding protein